jgi:DNA-binding MarR family transcriptional regulator
MPKSDASKDHDTWLRGRYYEALAGLAEGQSNAQQNRRQTLGLLQLINARLADIRAEHAAQSDVHPTDLLVLILLYLVDAGHTIRPTEIQRVLGFTAGGVTRRLTSMELKGLIRRSPDLLDGRAWQVSLTEHGEALARHHLAKNQGHNQKLEAEFSDDEWKTMVKLLDRFAKAIG